MARFLKSLEHFQQLEVETQRKKVERLYLTIPGKGSNTVYLYIS